jgi:hypothetical protein
MKSIYDVLRQKELAVESLNKEIDALRAVLPLLMDEKEQVASSTGTGTKTYTSSQQGTEPVVVRDNSKSSRVWP